MIRLLQIFNQYRSLFNGEEAVVYRTAELVERHGGRSRLLLRSSRDITGWVGKIRAFASGVYNPFAARQVARAVADFGPDVVHVHNLFPFFSPAAVVACRRAGVPVVMTLHNQVLTCPRADHLFQGRICDRCLGGKEYHCVLRNCRENLLESLAYAARSAHAHHRRLFHDNVTMFVALTEFARQRLILAGYDSERIAVLPNMAPGCHQPVDAAAGKYVAFAGRLSPEKGISTLLYAAALLPDIPFKIAGGGPLFGQFWRRTPPNVQLLGQLQPADMRDFYREARFLVVPSLTYEMCPLVIGEAMSHGLPVVASRLGGLPELVADHQTGRLFAPGDANELAACIRQLWDQPQVCRGYGESAWQKAAMEFGEAPYLQRLMGVYQRAMELVGRPPAVTSSADEEELSEAVLT